MKAGKSYFLLQLFNILLILKINYKSLFKSIYKYTKKIKTVVLK